MSVPSPSPPGAREPAGARDAPDRPEAAVGTLPPELVTLGGAARPYLQVVCRMFAQMAQPDPLPAGLSPGGPSRGASAGTASGHSGNLPR